MTSRPASRMAAVAGGVVLLLAAGAAVPAAFGEEAASAGARERNPQTIQACVNPATGVMAMRDSCKRGENPVRWNKQGPPGARGPVGPQGPAGPPGPQGPADTSALSGYEVISEWVTFYRQNTTYYLECPAGKVPLSASWDLRRTTADVTLTRSELVLTPRPGWRFSVFNGTEFDWEGSLGVLCVADPR